MTVAERGLVVTFTFPNLQELDGSEAALSCSLYLGLVAGLKQTGRFFIREKQTVSSTPYSGVWAAHSFFCSHWIF